MKLYGLSGTNGAGKDHVGEFLASKHGYLFVSMTDMLRDEAKRRGLPVSREVLSTISAEWRRESDLGVLIDKSLAHYEAQAKQYNGLVVASLRNPGETDRLHELGGTLIWVDADPRVRYERVQRNAASRGRADEDNKTFEEFLAEQEREMHPIGDSATLNMAAVKAGADLTIINNGNDIDSFEADVEKALGLAN